MFNDPKQIELYKALANPDALHNPLSEGNDNLVSSLAGHRETLDAVIEMFEGRCPHEPPAQCDCEELEALEELSEKLTLTSLSVAESSDELTKHAGGISGNLTQTVARFDVAIKINNAAFPDRRSDCGSTLEALGSVAGAGEDKIDGLVRESQDMTGDFDELVDEDGNLDAGSLARLMDRLDKLGISGDKVREFMEAERRTQAVLDNGLQNFALSSLLGDWADDPCLSAVFDSVAGDDIKDILQ